MEQELIEFVKRLDFEKVGKNKVRIVENEFDVDELPIAIKEYLKTYFEYLDSIN